MNEMFLALIMKYSLIAGVDPMLVTAIIQVESNFNPIAVGPVGELGLMQLRPEYFPAYTRKQLVNPEINIKLGTRHLAKKMRRCKHQRDNTSIVCYNLGVAGANRVKHPKLWPYYKKVMSAYEQYR